MKKIIIIIIFLCIVVYGCSKDEIPNPEPVNDGVDTVISPTVNAPTITESITDIPVTDAPSDNSPFIYENDSGVSYYIKELPFSCSYNEHTFSLNEIKYFKFTDREERNALFVALVLDVSDIPEKEVDWFVEDTDSILTSVYLTNDDNDYDFDSMEKLKVYHFVDSKELCYVYMTNPGKKYRYPFDKCSLSINFTVKQKEKYEYEGTRLHKSDTITYFVNITKDDIKTLGIMDTLESNIRVEYDKYIK